MLIVLDKIFYCICFFIIADFIMTNGMCQIVVFVLIVCGGLIQARYPYQDHSGTHDQTSKEDSKSKRRLTIQ